MDTDWSRYLSRFHAERAGVTETVLSRATTSGINPYDWLLEAVPSRGRVLDLACGSAPLWPALAGRDYVGLDVSAVELALAARRGAGPLAQASAAVLPVASGRFGVVVCSMALMLLTPLPATLREIGRVLAPGGRLVATLPDTGPLRVHDLPGVAGLLAALGQRLRYPNDGELLRLPALLADAGLCVVSDERRRFSYRLDRPVDADRFLASLYLPDLSPARYHATAAWLRALAGVRAAMPVPIRRLVVERP